MATIAQCDPERPLQITAVVDQLSDDPHFIALAEERGAEMLRRVATPFGEVIQIAPTDAAALLNAIRASPWRTEFEDSLASLAETTAGEALLTSVMGQQDAAAMLRDIANSDDRAAGSATAILDAIQRWSEEINRPFTVAVEAYQRD